jgi:hypothetical protein
MSEKACGSPSWTWPVKLDEYDRSPELKPEETETLHANRSSLVEGIPPSEVIEKMQAPTAPEATRGRLRSHRASAKILGELEGDDGARRCGSREELLGLDGGRMDREHQERQS